MGTESFNAKAVYDYEGFTINTEGTLRVHTQGGIDGTLTDKIEGGGGLTHIIKGYYVRDYKGNVGGLGFIIDSNGKKTFYTLVRIDPNPSPAGLYVGSETPTIVLAKMLKQPVQDQRCSMTMSLEPMEAGVSRKAQKPVL